MQESLTFGGTVKEIVSTITAKGQVTIPAEVRKHLGVGTNDRIMFIVEDSGEVKLKTPTYPTIASLRGAAGSLERPLEWHEMREIAREDRLEARRGEQE
jgi:AbrB family looped-hinge helix DNA binding protein